MPPEPARIRLEPGRGRRGAWRLPYVQSDAGDGFILVPHIATGGLHEPADHIVPLLQERGSLRADYTAGATLCENLGSKVAARAQRSTAGHGP
jgi:hypothetical protein